MNEVIGFFVAMLNVWASGVNGWQYVTSSHDPSRPWLRRMFLLASVFNAVSGFYLVWTSAMQLGG